MNADTSNSSAPGALEDPARTREDDRLAHLVLKEDWPIALCGARVAEGLGTSAPGRDRCYECHRIAQQRGLGRPGWGA